MSSPGQILDAALTLGEKEGWESVTLNRIAITLNIPLSDIQRHFSQKDDLVEAWFDRADQALLSQTPNPSWTSLPVRQRLEKVMLCWLDALAVHRQLTGQMLLYKLEPGHVHLQAAGVLRISRTVQWFREAAGLTGTHGTRIAQELALTSLYLATFTRWLRDDSDGQQKSREYLRKRLAIGERLRLWR